MAMVLACCCCCQLAQLLAGSAGGDPSRSLTRTVSPGTESAKEGIAGGESSSPCLSIIHGDYILSDWSVSLIRLKCIYNF
jgi:hypothetical protein